MLETVVMENSRDLLCHEKSARAPRRCKLATFAVNSGQVHVQDLQRETVTDHRQGGVSGAAVAHWHPTGVETIFKKVALSKYQDRGEMKSQDHLFERQCD